MDASVTVSVGGLSVSTAIAELKEILMKNSAAVMACVGTGVALLWRPGGSRPPIESQG